MIYAPENSFIQFSGIAEEDDCVLQVNTCLPVVRSEDISFQLIANEVESAPGPNEYVIKLFSECDIADIIEMPTGYYSTTDVFATVLWSHLSAEDLAYGLITINEDFNFAEILEEGQCFYLGIVRVSGDSYAYQDFTGITGTDITISVVIGGSPVSGVYDISDAQDIANAIEDLTGDNVQLQITIPYGISIITIHSSGPVYGNVTVGAEVFTADITSNEDDLIACSNCLKYQASDCYTTVIKYRNSENAFDFDYETNDEFYNIVRLSILIEKPQPVVNENVFRFSDGTYKTLQATFEKLFQGKTDWGGESFHFRLAIAMKHDDFGMKRSGESRFTSYVSEGQYEIEWADVEGFTTDIGMGTFKVKPYPYYQVNSNCAAT